MAANPREVITFVDIYTDFLDRTRESLNTGNVIFAQKYTNQALVDMHTNPGNKFYWAERPGVLITHAPYSTGLVAMLNSARTTLFGADTAWTTATTGFGYNNARAGGKVKISGITDVFRVASVTDATTLVLEAMYCGDDTFVATEYVYYEDEYALPSDFLRFVDMRVFSEQRSIPLVGDQDFRRWFGRNDVSGIPRAATHIQLEFSGDTAPRHRVVLSPYPNAAMQIPYWYVTSNLAVTSAGVAQARMVDTTDEPIVPRFYRRAIVLHALAEYYRDFKDDARSQEAKSEYIDLMGRMAGDTKVGQQRPRMQVVGRGVTPIRQRFETGGRFDSIRDR